MTRRLLQKFGFGRLRLKLAQVLALGCKRTTMKWFSKIRILPRIRAVSPIDCSGNTFEVHMLIEHRRVEEGAWAVYSLVRYPGIDLLPIFHDDGSLTVSDTNFLKHLFLGCRVITRNEADAQIESYLTSHNFQNCLRLRESLKFSLKLIDVIYFSRNPMVMLLDSDVLFFSDPGPGFEKSRIDQNACYMKDVASQYCCPAERMNILLGRSVVDRFNPGVAIVPTRKKDMKLIELLLNEPSFWKPNGEADYFAELTLWAALLDPQSSLVLPKQFALGAPKPDEKHIIAAHYCGDVRSKAEFYLSGLKNAAINGIN